MAFVSMGNMQKRQWIEGALKILSKWIEPHGLNIYKIGLFLDVPFETIKLCYEDKSETFPQKVYRLLFDAYMLHGDDFPAKLFHVFVNVLNFDENEFKSLCNLYKIFDPFCIPRVVELESDFQSEHKRLVNLCEKIAQDSDLSQRFRARFKCSRDGGVMAIVEMAFSVYNACGSVDFDC
jgi:tetrahydromethanopterin S-methyltransferase subunit G